MTPPDLTALVDVMQRQLDRAELEAKEQQQRDEALRLEMDRLREEAFEARARADLLEAEHLRTKSKLREHQLTELLFRLEALAAAKLLDSEELERIEDAIADAEGDDGDQVAQMAALSGKMVSDRALARQLRRKFCARA